MKNLRDSFDRSEYLSLKHDSYFQVYDKILNDYVGRSVVVVEAGVLNGGSLFMWRDFFGPQAKIIGIDLNPAAKKWEAEGFQIFIGDQSDENFWHEFYKSVGTIDIFIDDGGHTNRQQIVTVKNAIPHIRDGGVLIVEDVHASYMEVFGNPSPFSFIEYTKRIVDHINGRYGGESDAPPPATSVYSIQFFESIVVLNIDRRLCFRSSMVKNAGLSFDAEDFRYKQNAIDRITTRIYKTRGLVRRIYRKLLKREHRRQNESLRSYFDSIDV